MPFILTACGDTSLARLPIADVQRDGALCVSVLSRYLSAPWVVLLPRSAALRTPDGDAAARARSIFAVSIGRNILAGVARRRRSRDSREKSLGTRARLMISRHYRCKSLLITCHFSKHMYCPRDIIKSYSFVVLCCKSIGHRRENNESFVAHDSILLN